MSAHLLFWTLALANMAIALALALSGVRAAREKRFRTHKRRMLGAVGLVGLFVGGYALKLATLGRENLDAWERAEVIVLRVHEGFIAILLLSGALALRFARGAKIAESEALEAAPAKREAHRLAGRVAAAAFGLAFVTAGLMYWGILGRALP